MKASRTILALAALSFAVGSLSSCQNRAAIKALQEETAKLSDTAKLQNDEMMKATGSLDACQASLAKLKKKPATTPPPAQIEIPTASAEVTVAALESYKQSLTAAINSQNTRLEELKRDNDSCAAELATAQKRSKMVRTKAAPKPVAVQKAEEAGTATSGVKSRYKTKQ